MAHRKSTVQEWSEITSAAKRYIAKQSHDPDLRIDEVAEMLHVSVRTVQRALALANTDYSRELRIVRMEKAARGLSRRASVGLTAARSGYRSHAQFSRTFRLYYGLSPQTYRRIAVLEARLAWRNWNDQIRPVPAGSREYFRRTKRRADDVRQLRRLTRSLIPNARAALIANAAPPRPVVDLEAIRRSKAARSRYVRDQQFERAFELYLDRQVESQWLRLLA